MRVAVMITMAVMMASTAMTQLGSLLSQTGGHSRAGAEPSVHAARLDLDAAAANRAADGP
jgi:hypothetical protein